MVLPTNPALLDPAVATPAQHAGWHNEIHSSLPSLGQPLGLTTATSAGHLAHHEALAAHIATATLPTDLNEGSSDHAGDHLDIHTYLTPSLSKLRWSPAAVGLTMDLSHQTIHRGTGSTADIEGGTGASRKDTTVVIDSPLDKRVNCWNGRNWRIIGGESNITTQWASEDDRSPFNFSGATGIIWLEGLYLHGPYANNVNLALEGNGPNSPTPGTDARRIYMQNCRFDDFIDPTGTFHADLFQPYRGFEFFGIDKFTGSCNYQGGMLKADFQRWLTTEWYRMNLKVISPNQGRMINVVSATVASGTNPDGQPYVTGPVLWSEVYVETDPSNSGGALSAAVNPPTKYSYGTDSTYSRDYAVWAGDTTAPALPASVITGRLWKGTAASKTPVGDWVPLDYSGCPGMSYVSPGYLT